VANYRHDDSSFLASIILLAPGGSNVTPLTRFIPRNYLRNTEESNVYLCVGVESLFLGTYFVYPPASLLLIGLIFIGQSLLEAKKEANGTP
jgi:hypothetical protein